jgi:UDP-glucuronate 4-epimerase
MKVLVIGSHGFIGSRLVSNLIEKGHEVFGIDNLEIYSTKHIDFYFKNFDLRKKFFLKKLQYFEKFDCQNYIFLEKIVGTFKPDVVINLGGNSVADKCKENTYDSVRSIYNVNANILEVLKNIGIRIGFRSNNSISNIKSNLEVPREDHINIFHQIK